MCARFRPSGVQQLCRQVDYSCAGSPGARDLLVFVPVVVFVGTPLAPRPADCPVIAAPRLCEASRAGIRIIIPRACQALCIELSVVSPGEKASVEGPRCKKMVLPAAIREKSQR